MARLLLVLSFLRVPMLSPADPTDVCGQQAIRAGNAWVTHAGLNFSVSTPAECLSGGCGLIVDLHGGSMRAAQQEAEVGLSRLGRLARSRGATTPYIVVQPQANGDPPLWREQDGPAVFRAAMCVARKLNVPAGKAHLGGFSQGAWLAADILCRHPTVFASFSAIAGGGDVLEACLSRRQTGSTPLPPILYIHGRHDPLVPFSQATRFVGQARRATGSVTPRRSASGPVHLAGHGLLVEALFHDAAGLFAGGHCIPGGRGALGCAAPFEAPERIIDFYITNTTR